MSWCLLSPSHFVFHRNINTYTHIKSVGVFTPTAPNLSKHAGFQSIHSRAKEMRQLGRWGYAFSAVDEWFERKERFLWTIYICGTLSYSGSIAGRRQLSIACPVSVRWPLFSYDLLLLIIALYKIKCKKEKFAKFVRSGKNRQHFHSCVTCRLRTDFRFGRWCAYPPPSCQCCQLICYCSTEKQWQKSYIWLQFESRASLSRSDTKTSKELKTTTQSQEHWLHISSYCSNKHTRSHMYRDTCSYIEEFSSLTKKLISFGNLLTDYIQGNVTVDRY